MDRVVKASPETRACLQPRGEVKSAPPSRLPGSVEEETVFRVLNNPSQPFVQVQTRDR